METTDSLKWLNSESSVELINSLVYYNNYGELLNANCCDLSLSSNQLAICTNKHAFVMNFNFSWPSHFSNSSPYKYLSSSLSSKHSKTSSSLSSSQIDHWLQDLNESKNETICLHQIDTKIAHNLGSFTNDTIDMYERFFQLDETQRKKRKLFGSHTREPVNVKREKTNQENVQTVCQRAEKYIKDIEEIKLNKIAYAEHQILYEQSKLYDASYYELLSQMNTKSYQQQPSNVNKSLLFQGYKYCKWNLNQARALLATISNANHLILFDCSKLMPENTLNTSKKVDSFNITDYLLNSHYSYMRESKFDKIHEYLPNMNRLIPLCCEWSTKIMLDESSGFEFLFAANKSNEINVVVLPCNEFGNESKFVGLRMIQSIDCLDYLNFHEGNDDEALGNNLYNRNVNSFYSISSLKLINHTDNTMVLLVSFSIGHILILKLELDKSNIREALKDVRVELNQLKITPIDTKNVPCLNQLDRIACFPIDCTNHLIIVQSQNQLLFHRINLSTGQMERTFYFHFRKAVDLEKSNGNFYFTKNNYKLIGFEKCSTEPDRFDFALTFENSFVQLLEFDVINFKAHLKSDQQGLLLNCMETESEKIDSFKCTRRIFISSNCSLLFQINDFGKGNLVQKKSPNFQVNIYRINSLEKLTECLLTTDNESSDSNSLQISKHKYDLIWLLKRQIYLNFDSVMTQHSFEHLYGLLKKANKSKSNSNNARTNLSLFKYLRILSYFLKSYFETSLILDDFNKKFACQHEDKKKDCEVSNDEDSDEDEDEENEDYEDEDVNNEDLKRQKSTIEQSSMLKIENKKTKLNTCMSTTMEIIKSPEFYKTMFDEYSYQVYKYHAIGLLVSITEIDSRILNENERLVIYLMNEFCTKKNLYEDFDWSLSNSKEKPINEKQIKLWFEKNVKQFEKSKNESSGFLRCNLCSQKINLQEQSHLDQIKCESGHRFNRCHRTLLPLNFIKYMKCTICNSTWNLLDSNVYPSLIRLMTKKESCLFCS
jgi:hypothetical protein